MDLSQIKTILKRNINPTSFPTYQKVLKRMLDNIDDIDEDYLIEKEYLIQFPVAIYYYKGKDYVCFWDMNGNGPMEFEFKKNEYSALLHCLNHFNNFEVIDETRYLSKDKGLKFTFDFSIPLINL